MCALQDVCNCNVEGYDNSKEFCYPAHTACTPDAFGGTHGGHNCCDTYPDTGSDNVLVHSCPANLQGTRSRGSCGHYAPPHRAMIATFRWTIPMGTLFYFARRCGMTVPPSF